MTYDKAYSLRRKHEGAEEVKDGWGRRRRLMWN